MSIHIEIPDGVVEALKLPRGHVKEELVSLLSVKLYEKGILGMGKARELAGMSMYEFLALLKRENVYLNYGVEEFEKDLEQMKMFER